jgi:hypothetical protein
VTGNSKMFIWSCTLSNMTMMTLFLLNGKLNRCDGFW